MQTQTIKTSELTGAALDWAVAKAEGHLEPQEYRGKMIARVVIDPEYWAEDGKPMVRMNPCPDVYYEPEYAPSKHWSQGGPIIEREEMTVCWQYTTWVASLFNVRVSGEHEKHQSGPTPLIAAMRCYVASKIGDTVEIPKNLF